MNFKTWNPRRWVILCVSLLVLVGSLVAYFVFVPKVYEVDSLRKQVETAKNQRHRLSATPKPENTTDEQKRALAFLVPAQLEQPRFLQELHADAKAAGVVLKNIAFSDAAEAQTKPDTKADTKTTPTKPAAKSPAPQLPMQTFNGKLSVQGEYRQVRTFLGQFSSMTRLVTFNKWTLKAEQQDITPGVKLAANAQVAATQTQTQTRAASAPSPEEIRKQLTPELLSDKLLNDRTPIFAQADFNRYAESIRAAVPTLLNQHEKDLANLRIQQGFNRYTAGLLGLSEAESVFDQEIAHVFLPGTNANIRAVLGIRTAAPQPTPLPFVNQPDVTIENNHVFKTLVSLDVDFTIYYAPNALDLLPAQTPIHTYEPTRRSNLVESW
jgi:Tfp pilus assembly protein PilO